MKKMHSKYVLLIIISLAIIAALFIRINNINQNGKIIFYSYKKVDGILLTEENIIIYNDGTMLKSYKVENTDELYEYKFKLPEEEFTQIRKTMTNIENSELHIAEDSFWNDIIYNFGNIEEYINLNKKIILQDNNVIYTNEYIKELYKNIEQIKQKYLK